MATFLYKRRPRVLAAGSVAGKKEGAGPLGACFDEILPDDLLGKDTWEQAETEIALRAARRCLSKGGMTEKALDALLMGDLENQICASSFAARDLGAPFFGLYGACSTVIEALTLGAALVDGGFVVNCLCAASSHFCSAERQFRFPLELGTQRPPSAQWTATAAGAFLLHAREGRARVECATVGRVIDEKIKDANHMGAAMAPAVASTLTDHFGDTGRDADDYSLIVTGDLGIYGRKLLLTLMADRGCPLSPEKLMDCGEMLFSPDQDAHAGGSGCGCVASVLAGHFLPMLTDGRAQRLLVLGSGAMLSPTSSQQGQTIPGISYAVSLEGCK